MSKCKGSSQISRKGNLAEFTLIQEREVVRGQFPN
jgi:hypothetical protein